MKKICVTGAYGFIGKSMCKVLIDSNKNVLGLVRTLDPSLNFTNMICNIIICKHFKIIFHAIAIFFINSLNCKRELFF